MTFENSTLHVIFVDQILIRYYKLEVSLQYWMSETIDFLAYISKSSSVWRLYYSYHDTFLDIPLCSGSDIECITIKIFLLQKPSFYSSFTWLVTRKYILLPTLPPFQGLEVTWNHPYGRIKDFSWEIFLNAIAIVIFSWVKWWKIVNFLVLESMVRKEHQKWGYFTLFLVMV